MAGETGAPARLACMVIQRRNDGVGSPPRVAGGMAPHLSLTSALRARRTCLSLGGAPAGSSSVLRPEWHAAPRPVPPGALALPPGAMPGRCTVLRGHARQARRLDEDGDEVGVE